MRFWIVSVFSIAVINSNAQEFPLNDFIKVYLNKDKYKIEQYQTDTTLKSKQEFLNRLKVIDAASYNDLNGLMEMNGDKFPQSFFITDIDNDGIQEYIITENYEGEVNFCFTFKDHKFIRFLRNVPISELLIVNPQNIWSIANESYIGWERSMELLSMISNVYSFSMNTLQDKYQFKFYEPYQIPKVKELDNKFIVKPKSSIKPKKFVIKDPTHFYTECFMSDAYQTNGTITKGSYGWILADTLNAYFAVFDSTTSYVNDSLGTEKITYNDRGYMMCWIPKKVVDFAINDAKSGLYMDEKSKEYIRLVQTKDNLYISYFSNKTFEKGLIVDSSNPTENKYTVRFKKSGDKYLLEPKEDYKILECTNPNQTKQKFIKKG